MPDKGRVLHVITDTDRRGAQVAGAALDGELRRRGWTSRLIALQSGVHGGLEADALGHSPWDLRVLRGLRSAAAQADVVVAHGSTTLAACSAALVGSTPFVAVSIGDPRAWAPTFAQRVRVGYYARTAAAVVAISPTMAAALHEWHWVPDKKITTLRNFRDATLFSPFGPREREMVRRGLGWRTSETVVLWVGSMSMEKRPELVLDVAAQLPEYRFVMAGDGPLLSDVRKLAWRSGVELLGSVPDPWRVMASSDVLLMTSDTEGVPGVLVEAGLCGIPSVSTRVGFAADVVDDGRTGRLVEQGDVQGMVDGVREAALRREEWGGEAVALCRSQFAVDAVLPGWEHLLHSIVGRRV